jgi:hypothetical protein
MRVAHLPHDSSRLRIQRNASNAQPCHTKQPALHDQALRFGTVCPFLLQLRQIPAALLQSRRHALLALMLLRRWATPAVRPQHGCFHWCYLDNMTRWWARRLQHRQGSGAQAMEWIPSSLVHTGLSG